MGQANIRGTFEKRRRLSIEKYGRKEERKSAAMQALKAERSRLRKRMELQAHTQRQIIGMLENDNHLGAEELK